MRERVECVNAQGNDDLARDDVAGNVTSVFRVDFLHDVAPLRPADENAVSHVGGLPPGATMLVSTRGPNAGSQFLLDEGTTTAGRHPDSDVVLDDVSVSRRHTEFRVHDGAVWMVDVGSLNGTYLNREAVDSALLTHGDHVQIGRFRLVFMTTDG